MDAERFPQDMSRDNGDRRSQNRLYGEDDVLVLRDAHPPAQATLLDLSPDGVRIRMDAADEMPAEFALYLPEIGRARKVRVIRREGIELGLSFLDV